MFRLLSHWEGGGGVGDGKDLSHILPKKYFPWFSKMESNVVLESASSNRARGAGIHWKALTKKVGTSLAKATVWASVCQFATVGIKKYFNSNESWWDSFNSSDVYVCVVAGVTAAVVGGPTSFVIVGMAVLGNVLVAREDVREYVKEGWKTVKSSAKVAAIGSVVGVAYVSKAGVVGAKKVSHYGVVGAGFVAKAGVVGVATIGKGVVSIINMFR